MVKEVKKTKKVETEEEFLDLKEDSTREERLKKVLNIVLWVILFGWIVICFTDFILTKTEKEPIFCTFSKTTEYDDGEVESCIGLGYKVYNYDRESFSGIEFAPIWGKDKSAENE